MGGVLFFAQLGSTHAHFTPIAPLGIAFHRPWGYNGFIQKTLSEDML